MVVPSHLFGPVDVQWHHLPGGRASLGGAHFVATPPSPVLAPPRTMQTTRSDRGVARPRANSRASGSELSAPFSASARCERRGTPSRAPRPRSDRPDPQIKRVPRLRVPRQRSDSGSHPCRKPSRSDPRSPREPPAVDEPQRARHEPSSVTFSAREPRRAQRYAAHGDGDGCSSIHRHRGAKTVRALLRAGIRQSRPRKSATPHTRARRDARRPTDTRAVTRPTPARRPSKPSRRAMLSDTVHYKRRDTRDTTPAARPRPARASPRVTPGASEPPGEMFVSFAGDAYPRR